MATWISHLIIADGTLEKISVLDKHSFCVGNIAPDCNVENEDWTCFEPPREVTHWMTADRKKPSDCDRFYREYIENRRHEIQSREEMSFLLGYYAHLIADAEFQKFIRDETRVASAWTRIKRHPVLSGESAGMPETWDSVKNLIDKVERMKDIYSIEAEYLENHPVSSYLTEIFDLKSFPGYIDYLPKGAIPRKIGVMRYLPKKESGLYPFVAMTKEEYSFFLDNTTKIIVQKIGEHDWKGF